ncbi:MAG: VWA domain-containing protein [Myxococcales bacterium]|nr:VWA domain-containing protein [Myxococcales bacterium]
MKLSQREAGKHKYSKQGATMKTRTPTPIRFVGHVLSILVLGVGALMNLGSSTATAQQLSEGCLVNLLNYSAPVESDGTWVLPNLPVTPGYYRLRVVCTENGVTTRGMSPFFTMDGDEPVDFGQITMGVFDPPAQQLWVTGAELFTAVGQQSKLFVVAQLPGGEFRSASTGEAGTWYTSSNAAVATVGPDGTVTAVGNGLATIQVRNEGVTASHVVEVRIKMDDDDDGLPNHYEQIAGLNPADPGDAQLDPDGDLLTTFDEYFAGTHPFVADTDGDETTDGDELGTLGTDPLVPDTDGDTLVDGKEVFLGTDPLDVDSDNDGILDGIEIAMSLDPTLYDSTTTVVGNIVDALGAAVPDVAVVAFGQILTKTDAQGYFELPFVPEVEGQSNTIVCRWVKNGTVLQVEADFVPAPGGTTTVGQLQIAYLSESVGGYVMSPTQVPVPGANVTLIAGGETRTAVTDPEGLYFFGEVPPSWVVVQAIDPKTGLRQQWSGALTSGMALTPGLQLAPNGTIRGKVITAKEGNPAGDGITVQISGTVNWSQKTDVFSEFRFAYVPLGVYTVDAIGKDGRKGRTTATLNSTNQVFKANVQFLGQGTVMGTVTTATGQAVAGAKVTLKSNSVFGGETATFSAFDGSFQFTKVYVGLFELSAFHALSGLGGIGFGSIDSEGEFVEVPIVLTAAATLTGTVFEHGGTTPVAGIKVTVSPSGKSILTNPSGQYTFVGLPLGIYEIVATKLNGDWGKAATTLNVPDTTHTKDVVLLGTGTVLVHIHDGGGKPKPGVEVLLTSENVAGGKKQLISGPEGTCLFSNVLAGPVKIEANDPKGPLGGVVSTTVLAGEQAEVTITLEPSGIIQGQVYAPDGVSTSVGVKVVLQPTGQTFFTGSDGKFAFLNAPVAKSPFTVKVYDPAGTLRASESNIVLSFHGQIKNVNLTLSGMGTVKGTIYDPSGQPLLGANVSVKSMVEGGPTRTLITGITGQYQGNAIPVGPVQVSASKSAVQQFGNASGEVSFDKEIVTIDVTMKQNELQPQPNACGTLTTLFDANNFPFAICKAGYAADGFQNVVAGDGGNNRGALRLELIQGNTIKEFEAKDGLTMMAGQGVLTMAQGYFGLNVTRTVFVPHDGYFARFVDTLTNPTDSPITVTIRHKTTYGTRTGVEFGQTYTYGMDAVTTSSGDATLSHSQGDHWVTLDDNINGDPFLQIGTFPSVAQVFDGPDAVQSASKINYIKPFGIDERLQIATEFANVTVPPGDSVLVMQFFVQSTTQLGALTAAERLVTIPPEALYGLSPEQQAKIINFDMPEDGISTVEALPPRNGHVDLSVFEWDTTTPVPGATVRFISNNPLFGRTYKIAMNADGEAQLKSQLFKFGQTVAIPRESFTVEATHPQSKQLSGEVTGDFEDDFTDPQTLVSSASISFGSGGVISGVVYRPDNTVVSFGEVVLSGPELSHQVTTKLNADGSFLFGGLPAGTYALQATMTVPQGTGLKGFISATVELSQTTYTTIFVEPAGMLVGTVFQGGLPLANVAIKASGPNFSRTTTSDTGGAFVLSDMPLGTFTVTATESKSKLKASAEVEIFDNEVTTVNLVIDGLGTVDLTATFADASPAANAKVLIAKGPPGTGFGYVGTASVTGKLSIPSVPTGPFTVRVIHPKNDALLVEVSGMVTTHKEVVPITAVLPIDAPPSVELTAPAAGTSATAGANITVSATATDDLGVVAVSFVVNGKTVATKWAPPYGATVKVEAPPGSTTMTIVAVATDNGQNSKVSAPVTVEVVPDETPPSVQITSPGDGATFIEGKQITVMTTITDNIGISKTEFFANGALFASYGAAVAQSKFTIPSDMASTGTTELVILVRATDTSGSTTQDTVTLGVTVDQPPTLTVTQAPIPNSSVIEGTPIMFQATATDDMGLSVSLLADGVVVQTRFQPPYHFSVVAPAADSVINPVTYLVRAKDTKGQTADSDPYPLIIVEDTAPTVTIVSPADGAEVTEGATVLIQTDADDDLGVTQVEWKVGGTTVGTDSTAPFTFAVQIPGGDDGTPIAIEAIASDTIGQTGSNSITVVLKDDLVAPSEVTIVAPVDGTTLPTAPSDIVLVIDRSSSGAVNLGKDIDGDGTNDTALKALILTAKELIQFVNPAQTKLGLVLVGNTASVQSPLVFDVELMGALLDDALVQGASGTSNWSAGIDTAINIVVGGSARQESQAVVLFLTAGNGTVSTQVKNRAKFGGVSVSSFGLGANVNSAQLMSLAAETGGSFSPMAGPEGLLDAVSSLTGLGLGTIGVTVEATDDVSIESITAVLTSPDGDLDLTLTDNTPPYSFVFPIGNVDAETPLTFVATAADAGGNQTTSQPVIVTALPSATPPTLVSINPTFGLPGDSVVLLGKNFDPFSIAQQVSFGGVLGTIVDGDKIKLTITVPEGGTSGLVTVTAAGQTSNGLWFSYDTDGDGLFDEDEAIYGSDPTMVDTDSDGLGDYEEVLVHGTSPAHDDTDEDGLLDPWEITWGTDPLTDGDGEEDLDNDGLNNLGEQTANTDPTDPDTDGDTLTDGDEVLTIGSNPLSNDTDLDTLPDAYEVQWGLDPNDPADATADGDGDGLDNLGEFAAKTKPTVADTDGDGLPDGAEVLVYLTKPLVPDTDTDGLTDGAEINTHLTSPLTSDTDADGLSDGAEITVIGSNPLVADTDADGLNDGDEVYLFGTDALVPDTDGDTVDDGAEVNTFGTHPNSADTDGDGYADGAELNIYFTNPNVPDICKEELCDEMGCTLVDITQTYCCESTRYHETFTSGTSAGYAFDPSPTLVTWQVTKFGKSSSAPGALYFGNTITKSFALAQGTTKLTSPKVFIPDEDDTQLTFKLLLDMTTFPAGDSLTLSVNVNTTTTQVWSKGPSDPVGQWKTILVPLEDYRGETIQFVWAYAALEGSPKVGEGIYIDDIQVDMTCPPVPCTSVAECDDNNACTEDSCGFEQGCQHTAIVCEDNNPCTTDSCNPTSGCTFVNNTLACNDGDACTTADKCGGGTCAGTITNCNDNNVCTDDGCDSGTGCFHNNNTAACTDGNACTTGDSCVDGQCVTTPLVCDDSNVCTTDSCNPQTGCVFALISCSDGDFCNGPEGCDPTLGCQPASPVDCNDSNACTDDACDSLAGCVYTPILCSDGDGCNGLESCHPQSGCQPGTAPNCNDNVACTTDGCHPTTGCFHTADNTLCDDGQACSTAETCHPTLGCQYTVDPSQCDDNNACTTDQCVGGTGCIHPPIVCDDGISCTTNGCDPQSGCTFADNCTGPIVNAGVDTSTTEGTAFVRTVTITDPDTENYSATVNWGDNSPIQSVTVTPAKTISLNHVFKDDGVYPVTVVVTDSSGKQGTDVVEVTVTNVAPTLELGDPIVITTQGPFVLNRQLVDPGADTWSGTVSYGDGTPDEPLIVSATGLITLTHTYTTAGNYVITVNVSDDDNGTATDTLSVVYTADFDCANPPAGYVRWVGGASGAQSSWTTAANWFPAGVPTSNTDIILCNGSTHYPIITANGAVVRNVLLDSAAPITINLGYTLNAYGSVVGGQWNGSGYLRMVGTDKLLAAVVQNLTIAKKITLGGPTAVKQNIVIEAGSTLRLAGHTLTVNGNSSVYTAAVSTGAPQHGYVMTDPNDRLHVYGTMLFHSNDLEQANTTGQYTAGEIHHYGASFTVSRGYQAAARAFVSTGTKVFFEGTAAQTVNFHLTGNGGTVTEARFHDVLFANPAGVTVVSNLIVGGFLDIAPNTFVKQSASYYTNYTTMLPMDGPGYQITNSVIRSYTPMVVGTDRNYSAVPTHFWLSGGATVQLNGHAWAMTGNLTLDGSDILKIEGGQLTIGGALWVSMVNPSGGKTYGLHMTDAADIVDVAGAATFWAPDYQSAVNTLNQFTHGELQVGGNFKADYGYQSSPRTFVSSGTKVVLDGTSPQTVYTRITSSDLSQSRFDDLEITNPTGVTFTQNVTVMGQLLLAPGAVVSQTSAFQTSYVNSMPSDGPNYQIVFTSLRGSTPTVMDSPRSYSWPSAQLLIYGGKVLDQNGHDLEFGSSCTIYASGGLKVNGASTLFGGHLSVYHDNLVTGSESHGLVMNHPADDVTVNGNAWFGTVDYASSSSSSGKLTDGILRVRGNFTTNTGYQASMRAFISTGTKVRFEGTAPQTVSVSVNVDSDTLSRFKDIEIADGSNVTFTTGMVIHGYLDLQGSATVAQTTSYTVYATKLPDDGPGYQIKSSVIRSSTPLVMDSPRVYSAPSVSFTVNANTDWNLAGHDLSLTGTLGVNPAGALIIDSSKVDVGGSFNVYVDNASGTTGPMGLIMTHADGELNVGGNAFFATPDYATNGTTVGQLTAGTLRVMGNFTTTIGYQASARAFCSTGTKVVLNGTTPQTVSLAISELATTTSRFADLEILNTQGVTFGSYVTITGQLTLGDGAIVQQANTKSTSYTSSLPTGGPNYKIQISYIVGPITATVPRAYPYNLAHFTITSTGSLKLAQNNWDVGGTLSINPGGMVDLQGAQVQVGGNFAAGVANTPVGGADRGLVMRGNNDLLDIAGNAQFYTGDYENAASTSGRLTAGEIRIGGNFTQWAGYQGSGGGFVSSGTKVILDGAAAQTVNFAHPGTSRFRAIDISNPVGVTFTSEVYVDDKLTLVGGGRVVQSGSFSTRYIQKMPAIENGSYEVTNTRVTGQVTMDAPLSLLYSTNHLLIDSGNVGLRPGGYPLVIGGALSVSLSTNTEVGLVMTLPEDDVRVKGNVTFRSVDYASTANSSNSLKAGVLRIGGNLSQIADYQGSPYAFICNGTKVIFDGAGPQTVSFQTPGTGSSRFKDVEFQNTGGGVTMTTSVNVVGQLTMVSGTLTQSASYVVDYSNALPITSPGYAVKNTRVVSAITMGANTTLPNGGNLTIVSGAKLVTNGYMLTVTGNLSVTSGTTGEHGLVMKNPADQVSVLGNAAFANIDYWNGTTSGNFTGGTLSIGGNFTETKNYQANGLAFVSTGTKVVFNGLGAQSISFQSPNLSKFSTVEFAGTGTVTLATDVYASGVLMSPGAIVPKITSANRLLSVAGLNVDGLVVENTRIVSTQGTVTQFDNVTFQSMGNTVDALTLTHAGTTNTFSGLNFKYIPTTGRYIVANKTAGATPCQLTVATSTPKYGVPKTATSGGYTLVWGDPADDTDGDGLADSAEFGALGTNPLVADTDGDGANDGAEVGLGTDPKSAASVPLKWGTPTTLSAGVDATQLAVGDLNGDTLEDIAVVNPTEGLVATFLQDTLAPGTWLNGAVLDTGVGSAPSGLALTDADGDSAIDIVVTLEATGELAIFVQDITQPGEFLAPVMMFVCNGPTAVIAADFVGTSNPDLAIACTGDGTVDIRESVNTLDFYGDANTILNVLGVSQLSAADINGDQLVDLVASAPTDDAVVVALQDNNVIGTWQPPVMVPTGAQGATPTAVVAQDFTDDGMVDLMVVNAGEETVVLLQQNNTTPGDWHEPQVVGSGSGVLRLDSADIDGNGQLDLAASNDTQTTTTVWLHAPAAPTTWYGITKSLPGPTHDVRISSDLNKDGNPDLIASHPTTGTISVHLQQ